MIILNSLFPVFSIIILGVLLKKSGMTAAGFLRQSDKLVYFIFFPIMLFWKIGSSGHAGTFDPLFCLAVLAAFGVAFLVSLLIIRFRPVEPFQAGTFSQSCYRFNTYIGVAVILNSLGEPGIAYFGMVIAIVIPLVNVASVSVLIWYSGSTVEQGNRWTMLIKALIGNPLIISCLLGLLYGRFIGVFPVFIDNSLRLISTVALPLALISIGGALSFRGLRLHLRTAFLSTLVKLVLLPITGYLLFHYLGITDVPRRVGLIFFSLPTSTAIYVLSAQLHSDTELASATIVVSTLLSFVSLSVALLV